MTYEKKNFNIKPIDFDKLNALTETFRLCFGIDPPENYFEYKFLRNPAGKAVGFTAYHENKIAGFYGVIPENFIINGEKVIIYQSMDTMTHPNYQRQGLFTTLAKKTYEDIIEKKKEAFVIGFPGDLSNPGLIKMGWKNIATIDLIFLNRNIFKLKSLLKKHSTLSITEITRFNEDFTTYFNNKNYSYNKILLFMDENTLNWRLVDHPIHKFKIAKITETNNLIGFVIYRLDEKNRCFIHYIDFADDDFYKKYLNTVCDYLFEKNQCNYIYTFKPSNPFISEAYKSSWFIKNICNKGPFSHKPLFSCFSNAEKINGLSFFQERNYDIQPILRDY